MSRIYLVAICSAYLFTGCVFSVDHEETMSHGEPDAGHPDDGDIDDDDTKQPADVTVEFLNTPDDITDVGAGDILEYEFACSSDDDCQIECAYSIEEVPSDDDWNDCDSPYQPETLGTDEGDFTLYLRAYTEDRVSDVISHTTSLRLFFALQNNLPESNDLIDPRLGDVTIGCLRDSDIAGCDFTECRLGPEECDGADCDLGCADGTLSGESELTLESLTLPDTDEDTIIFIKACAPEFSDHSTPHCLTLQRTYRLVPPQWRTVSTGGFHTCAIADNDDSLWCWGANNDGQVGLESGANEVLIAQQITDLRWNEISAGQRHSCGITINGELNCWGNHEDGRLGIEAIADDATSPIQVGDRDDWEIVSAGQKHSCGITSTGDLFCWGSDQYGQLGNGAANGDSETPFPVIHPDEESNDSPDWLAVSAGATHTCAIDTEETPYCWGRGEQGQLGDGDGETRFAPSPVNTSDDFKNISAGNTHTCALAQSSAGASRTYCWGSYEHGRLGNENIDPNSPAAENINSPLDVTTANGNSYESISVGAEHSCGIDEDGHAYCWGSPADQRLGFSSAESAVIIPTIVTDEETFTTISNGQLHTCAITTFDNDLYCWGHAGSGQLGNSESSSSFPFQTRIYWYHTQGL